MSYNARVRKRKSPKTGINSLTFSIVRNWRDKSKNGEPNQETVSYIKSIKAPALLNPIVQNSLWFLIDLSIHKLLKNGTITDIDKSNIEKRFAEIVSRPGIRAATLPIANPMIKADAKARVRERFKEFF
jgi:hypothetical protein